MSRIFTGYIDENDCIGDSLGDQTIGGGIKGSINGNFLSLDNTIQSLSAGPTGNFQVGDNLTVNSDALIQNNLTVNNIISAKNDIVVNGYIEVYEEIYRRGAIATGGNIPSYDVVYDGRPYRIHTFTTPGAANFTVQRSGEIEFLLVGGGGSGGMHNTNNVNGGGGGGGVLYKEKHYVTAGSYSVFVGNGGAAIADSVPSAGNNGENTTFLGYVAYGGGGGGATAANQVSKAGGSSGGAGKNNNIAAHSLQVDVSGARGYGNRGGDYTRDWTGCGGGGAGSPGHNGDFATRWAADGGRGMPFIISGVERFYGGGGGGGANAAEHAGMGWHGGGRGVGNTFYYNNANFPEEINGDTLGFGTPNGIANTGGGGGAGSHSNTAFVTSGAGGSGIIIVRYRL